MTRSLPHVRRLLVVAAALALVFAACGDSGGDEGAASTSAASAAPSEGRATGPQASIIELRGTSTSVDLDPDTMEVLADNGVEVSPVEPATVSTTADGKTNVSFPITAGYVAVYPQADAPFVRGTFAHSGGLEFTAGGTTVTVTDFIVNPGSSTLTATVGEPGSQAVQILDLDGTDVAISKDDRGRTLLDGTVAKLSSAAADALNDAFGVSLFAQGIPLGVVHIVAEGTAGPGGAPDAEILQLAGTSTNVTLNADTAQVLADNGVSLAPVGEATAEESGGDTVVRFPITEGYVSLYPQGEDPFIRGTVSHMGGISLTAGSTTVTATDFIVNPGSSDLTATVGGEGLKLFDLDGTDVRVSSGSGDDVELNGTVVRLSEEGAGALNDAFGVSLFQQGIPIGTVQLIATPSSFTP